MTRYVIVGGGVAGVTAARALADRVSQDDDILMLSRESYPYYPRPLLWRYIAGAKEEEELYFKPLSWYDEQGITFRLDINVTDLDAEAHLLTLEDGEEIPYDRLLLATGARPFVPPVEGRDKSGVFTLRTLDDAKKIKAFAEEVPQAVVIGGGLLGLETARALGEAGPAAHVVEIAEHLLPRQLDAEGAQVLRSLLEDQGLGVTTGAIVEAILGGDRAERVRTKEGDVIEGQLVLFSTGIRCRAKLAKDAGLEVNRGAVVDETMRTSAEDVFAAGDVAEFRERIYGIIPPAMEQAEVAAANMVEPGSESYAGTVPSTTLEVAGARVTSLGEYDPEDEDAYGIVRHTDAERGLYRKFVLDEGRIVGAIMLNDPQRAALARPLIDRRIDVSADAERLTRDDFDLKSLL
jgi:nitrite reductase (NADH) large subunit